MSERPSLLKLLKIYESFSMTTVTKIFNSLLNITLLQTLEAQKIIFSFQVIFEARVKSALGSLKHETDDARL